jgi:hypothetical protein
MATVNKDFKIKSGLIVEGTTATVNGFDVLTKKTADQDYIVGLIGGTATSANEANKVVKRDASGNFAAGTITANVTGTVSSLSNHDTADLAEGTNLYFTNARAISATAASYDAAGTAATEAGLVAGDLADHESATAAHGATGAVVGTTNTQTLTNKTIGDTLNFTGAGAMTINSDSHIVLTPAAGSSVKWGADVLATENYVDGEISTEVTNRNTAITTALTTAQGYADTAEGNANDYTDSSISTEVTNRNTAISTAIGTEVTDRNSAIATAKAQAIADAEAYTDAEVAALVDTAPALLDTLNELAAAIADNPNYATDTANAVAGRVAKAGDTMTGALTLSGAPTLNLHAATKGYVDGEIDTLDTAAQGYADAAETASNGYTDIAIGTEVSDRNDAIGYAISTEITNRNNAISTAKGEAISSANSYADGVGAAANGYTDGAIGTEVANRNDAITNAISTEVTNRNNAITSAVDALSTNDIEEGSNLYFTDARAKTSAADLLTGASLTNITITGTGAGLTITAENGVADSDTDDLTEGATNLYFTPNRAVNALQAVTPNFTAVDLNSVAKQVAATLSAPTAGIQTAYSFVKADYRSAEFLVKVAYGTHTEISKVLLTLDSSDNIAITEYGIVGTNGSASSISAAISSSGRAVELQVTTVNNNSTVTVVGTLLA